ncbi:MAG: hypothetical protein RLY97_850 [Pseudomonadota bacterium]|jgi:hypothetical protein
MLAPKAMVRFGSGWSENGAVREPERSGHLGREHRKHRTVPFAALPEPNIAIA